MYKRSTDAGRSWSKIQTLLDPIKMFPPSQCPTDSASVRSENTSCVFWDPTPIVDRQKGAVFLLTTRSWAHDGMTGFASRENSYMDMWAVKSTDVGRVSTHRHPAPVPAPHDRAPPQGSPIHLRSDLRGFSADVERAEEHHLPGLERAAAHARPEQRPRHPDLHRAAHRPGMRAARRRHPGDAYEGALRDRVLR